MPTSLSDGSPTELRHAWHELKSQRGMRARDAALALGVSEAELVASECGETATRIEADFRHLFMQLPRLGRVMALTRNESCVHERVGRFQDVSYDGQTGLVLGPDIDLRVFFSHWRFGYAVEEPSPQGLKRSIQCFDAHGGAVHKIHLRPESDVAAFHELVALFRSDRQTPGEVVEPLPPRHEDLPDDRIDVSAMRADWAAMTDTHEFFPLLKRHGLGREQALRLADPEFAQRMPVASVRALLDEAARTALPIMVFVGNAGVIQIHTGAVHNIRVMGPWLNVMDPDFNLHLREDQVHSVWMVRKPTRDGIVSSLELFDPHGANIALFFGKRKPGLPEAGDWRELLRALPADCGV